MIESERCGAVRSGRAAFCRVVAWACGCFARTTFVAILALFQGDSSGAADNEEISRALRSWIKQDIYFFKDRSGSHRLFVRREPVRAFIHSDIALTPEHVENALKLFAEAAELPLEITNRNPNIIVVVTSPINDGGKPNWKLFQRLGLPEIALNVVGETGSWASGCGIYTFSGPDETAALSLIFAEKGLPNRQLTDCLTEGTIRAFGVHSNAKTSVHSSDGYFYYLQLVAALRHCDKSIDAARNASDPGQLESRYVDCAAEHLLKRR